MLTKFEVRPNTGSTLTLNDLNYPLHVLEIETNIDTHEFKRMAAAGEWPTFHYPGAMTIHAEGEILGTGASDSAISNDTVSKRLALLDAILPPIGLLTTRKHGVIRIKMDGMTEDADADVVVVSLSAPMNAMSPGRVPFIVTWKGFNPWFTGVTTPTNKYQLG